MVLINPSQALLHGVFDEVQRRRQECLEKLLKINSWRRISSRSRRRRRLLGIRIINHWNHSSSSYWQFLECPSLGRIIDATVDYPFVRVGAENKWMVVVLKLAGRPEEVMTEGTGSPDLVTTMLDGGFRMVDWSS